VYLYDKVEHIVIMDDCGSNSVTLKEYMQNGRCSVETAHRIGKEVGNFIGHLHTWGKGNPDVYEFFEQNQQGKILSSWIFYGHLLLTFDEGLEKLQNPDVMPSEAERGALEKIAEETIDTVKKVTGTVCAFILTCLQG
jgi:5-methylthioribose kinase